MFSCFSCWKRFLISLSILVLNVSNHDNNKFILLLQKGVYPNEYMDDWEIFNETSLSEKEDFYSHLYTEDVTHADCAHAKKSF